MLVGILSDTHNQRKRTQAAVQLLKAEGAEALIHCGDLVEPDLIDLCAVMPFYLVFGNNDVHNVAEIQAAMQNSEAATCLDWGGEVELAGKRIAVTHGHVYKVYHQLLATQPDYLLTGHSHVAADDREGTTRLINPGALHRASPYTVAILNLADDSLRFLTIPT
jgi:putative phosphoesterase